MKKLMLALVTGLFVAGSMAMTGPAFGQGRLNMFNRVLASLMNELHVGGYDVWDEVAVTGNLAQDRSRRTNEEIISVARLVQRPPPIDVAVSFSIYPSAVKTQVAAGYLTHGPWCSTASTMKTPC